MDCGGCVEGTVVGLVNTGRVAGFAVVVVVVVVVAVVVDGEEEEEEGTGAGLVKVGMGRGFTVEDGKGFVAEV